MTSKMICPACEVGHVEPSTYADDFQQGDRTVHVDGLEISLCDSCGSEFIFPEQAKRNHLRVADAKRSMEGLLSGAELRAIREHLELTQQEAAKLFGGGINAFSKYERGEIIQSKSTDVLLRMISEVPDAYSWLQAFSDGQMSAVFVPLTFYGGDSNWAYQEGLGLVSSRLHPADRMFAVNEEFDSPEWSNVAVARRR